MEFCPPQEYHIGEILVPAESIQERLALFASEIAQKYHRQNLLVIGLLKGAFILTSDLVRELYKAGLTDVDLDFMRVESYSNGTESSQNVKIIEDTRTNPCNRHVLLVDDILDTTLSLAKTHQYAQNKGAQSIESLALIAKPERHLTSYRPSYIGFTIPNIWIEGYGMDSFQHGRANPNIVVGPTFKR